MTRTIRKQASRKAASTPEASVPMVMAWLEKHASAKTRAGMARYAIPSDHALGVTVADIRRLAKQLGRHHELAVALWETGVYEARMLTAFIAEPERVTTAQMDRWCRDFDNWAICDTLCFHLFDRTPHAWKKIAQWSKRSNEFEKRAAFALLWGLAVHDRNSADKSFREALQLIEASAADERNFVKKAVNMALRAIGKRNAALNAAAVKTAQRMAQAADPVARWNGKDALRELTGPSVRRRLGKRG